MKAIFIKENLTKIIAGIMFFAAGVILVMGDYGTLTLPGILAATLGLFCLVKNRYSAVIGITAAVISFTGQYLVGYCHTCFISATCFAYAGMFVLLTQKRYMLIIPSATVVILATVLLIPNPQDTRPEVVYPEIRSNQAIVETEESQGKAKLYISTTCPSCTKVVQEFIAQDKEGKLWQPVIVPTAFLLQGEKYLRDKGYEGQVFSTGSSPTKQIPCLQNNDTVISGSKAISEQLKNIFKAG